MIFFLVSIGSIEISGFVIAIGVLCDGFGVLGFLGLRLVGWWLAISQQLGWR